MLYVFLLILVIYLLIPTKKIKFGIVKFKNYIIPICIISLLILLVIFSEDAYSSAHNGLLLWVNNVVPSLFPFLICLEVLKKTNIIKVIGRLLEPIIRPIFNIPGSGAFAVVMGMCSGYPIGAKFAASLRETNQCSLAEGERLLAFTNTSGPLFIVGAVGIGMFANSKIGFLLLITHFIAALIVGFVFRFYKNKEIIASNISKDHNSENNDKFSKKNKSSETIKLSQLGSIMGEAIKSSIATLLLICGFITFFCVLGTILDKSGVTNLISDFICNLFVWLGFSKDLVNELSVGCFKGILEITNGLKILSTSNINYNTLLPIVATILGFGGISVHMQVASIISDTDLSLKPYLLGKTLHGIFAGIITYLVVNYTNFFGLESVETFSAITTNNIVGEHFSEINLTANYAFGNSITSFIGSGNILLIGISLLVIASLITLLSKRKIY